MNRVCSLPSLRPGGQDVVLRVRGTVQGVGFRPFVWRTASRLHLRGWVRNDPQGVLIRAAGNPAAVEELIRTIRSDAPSAARVDAVESSDPHSDTAPITELFAIAPSASEGLELETSSPPDLAICAECRRELFDAADRRYHYPFTNCTQCGPRYSILERLPYDRPTTTMRAFRMCERCEGEYNDPANRRFHAQPNCCPDCGPQLYLTLPSGERRSGAVIQESVAALRAGGILAVKGIGGYHLMVDASNRGAVLELRRRKARDAKPFAVMFRDLAQAKTAAMVTPEAAALLTSPAAPIVLLERAAAQSGIAAEIAPGNPWIGAMLPYAPLQVLLLEAFGGPLVATSANLSDEPLCFDEHDAQRRLAGIADGFLEHERRIARPADDSVFRFAGSVKITLRRARGYTPTPLVLPGEIAGSWLCAGGQMKNAAATASGRRLLLSPHLGDLSGARTQKLFERTAEMMSDLQGDPLTGVACDRHPDYASTRYAEKLGLPVVHVQHHLAHILACLLEHRWPAEEAVLGVAWDGTGYGEDGMVWGGEFILVKNRCASRFGRLRPFGLPGGEAAVRDGRRVALALAHASGGEHFERLAAEMGLESSAGLLRRMLELSLNSPATTSAGRLFDAVGALLGLGGENRFEGQTGLAVEAAARKSTQRHELSLLLRRLEGGQGARCELDWSPTFAALSAGRAHGPSPADWAAAFHRALAAGIVAVAREADVETVALSGGCFQNALLVELTASALRAAGFRVLLHRDLPPNDGNLAAGQALAVLWGLASVHLP